MAGAIQMLKDDHNTVEELFGRFESAGPEANQEKRHIRDRILKELSVHAFVEEQVFYPATKAARGETEEMVQEALQEHAEVKSLLRELSQLEPDDARFDELMQRLIQNVRHHVEEEEGEMFPKVNDAMSSQELSDLGDRLQEAKRGAPEAPE